MNRSRFCLALVVSVLAVVGARRSGAQTSYTWTDIGTLPGGTTAGATQINNANQVVGTSNLANGDQHAFYWSASTGMVDIGTLAGTPGSTSHAGSINNSGEVVGSSTTSSGVWHGFLWNTASHVLTDLNLLLSPTDGANWVVTGAGVINQNHIILGSGTTTINGTVVSHAILLDLNTLPYPTITDLGASGAHYLNDHTSPQVTFSISGVAYLWDGAPPLVSLAPLYGGNCINNVSQIVGYLQNADFGYLSAPGGTPLDLGVNGTFGSINNGSPAPVTAVGTGSLRKGVQVIYHAYRWIVGSAGVQDLNGLTLNLGKLQLISASSVNDSGYIVCGADKAGYATGSTRAYLLTPH